MENYRLDSMASTAIALDLETDLIQPGLIAPPMVLGSAAVLGEDGKVHGQLLSKDAVRELFLAILADPSIVVPGANIAFDFLVLAVDFARRGLDVMPQIFAMYDPKNEVVRGRCDGRVFEIQLTEGLHAIAQGHLGKRALTGETIVNRETKRPARYSLDTVTSEVLGREDAKINDAYRRSYGLFHDVPLDELPPKTQQYPVDDACNTVEDALAQAGHLPSVNRHEFQVENKPPYRLICVHCGVGAELRKTACMRRARRRNLHALSLQAYFAWAAHNGSSWGLHVDQDEVDRLEARIDAQREASIGPFREAGIIRDDGTEDQGVLKRRVAIAYGAKDPCPTCAGTGKVPSPKTDGKTKINCAACDGTKLALPPEVPRAEKGGVGKSRDVCSESGDELLMDYAEQPSKKIKTTYIPLMRRGRACNVCGGTGVETKYKKAHEDWCTAPDGSSGYRKIPLIVRVDPLKETLRASIEDGLHSMPRRGGVRECFRARDGFILSSEDYKAGELVTLADACLRLLGWSQLGDALNSQLDPHLALAGTFCGKSYEEMKAAKKAKEPWLDILRQIAKKSNFGYGGGMAELEFVLKPCRADPDSFTPCENGPTKRNFGTEANPKWVRGFNGARPCIMMDGADYCGRPGEKVLEYRDRPTGSPVCIRCLLAGKRARDMWFAQWAEMRKFFSVVKEQISVEGPSGTPEIDYPELITRGNLGFCDGANGYFQMALAKAAKAAFCQVQRECLDRTIRVHSSEMMDSRYDGCESPLYGSRAILLFHDEIVAEHPESVASDGAIRVSEIMVESLRWKCPRMKRAVEAKPTLIRRLYKGAEPRYLRGGDEPADANDPVIPWEPKLAT